jgi:hypothetical protein
VRGVRRGCGVYVVSPWVNVIPDHGVVAVFGGWGCWWEVGVVGGFGVNGVPGLRFWWRECLLRGSAALDWDELSTDSLWITDEGCG